MYSGNILNKLVLFFLICHVYIISCSWRHIRENFFSRVNSDLQTLTNKIFTQLKLGSEFRNKVKHKLLASMQDDLAKIAEYNYDMYQLMRNASKTKFDNDKKTINLLFNMSQVMDELFYEKHSFLTNDTIGDIKFSDNVSIFPMTGASVRLFNKIINSNFKRVVQENENIKDSLMLELPKLTGSEVKAKPKGRRNDSKSDEVFENIHNDTRRIYMGEKARIRKYSFLGSIHLGGDFMCAGSIISKDLMISAASCLQLAYDNLNNSVPTNPITVRIKSDFTNQQGEVIPVVHVYFHPGYDPVYLTHNLAIAKLKIPLQFGKQTKVRRIEFDRFPVEMPLKGTVTILGWGDLNKDAIYMGPLTMAELKVFNLDDCMDIYPEKYVSDMNFCAGALTSGGGGACNRDVGGPGLIGSRLIGVISFGPSVCGTVTAPTVLTKLGYYTEWMDSIIDQTEKTQSNQMIYPTDPTPPPFPTAPTTTQVNINADIPMYEEILLRTNPPILKSSAVTVSANSYEIKVLHKLFQKHVLSGNVRLGDLMKPIQRMAPIPTKSQKHKNKRWKEIRNVGLPETFLTQQTELDIPVTQYTTTSEPSQLDPDILKEIEKIKNMIEPVIARQSKQNSKGTKKNFPQLNKHKHTALITASKDVPDSYVMSTVGAIEEKNPGYRSEFGYMNPKAKPMESDERQTFTEFDPQKMALDSLENINFPARSNPMVSSLHFPNGLSDTIPNAHEADQMQDMIMNSGGNINLPTDHFYNEKSSEFFNQQQTENNEYSMPYRRSIFDYLII